MDFTLQQAMDEAQRLNDLGCLSDSAKAARTLWRVVVGLPVPGAPASPQVTDERYVLKQIIDALPSCRDWLDPDIEKVARALLSVPPAAETYFDGVSEGMNAVAQQEEKPVLMEVWYGSMPESNGKSNFSATLRRKGASLFDTNCYTFARSEYPDRVRYEADSMRFLIGEIDKEPFILDYDADKHSGYVARPSADAKDSLDAARYRALLDAEYTVDIYYLLDDERFKHDPSSKLARIRIDAFADGLAAIAAKGAGK